MSDIVNKLKKIPDLTALEGCSIQQVNEAQSELGLIFPDDYVKYVREFGCVDFGVNEWTGLNVKGRLNTVEATKKEMSVNANFPKGYFVLENLGIDAKHIIVNEKGEVYLLQYEKKMYLCGSISEYLDICLN